MIRKRFKSYLIFLFIFLFILFVTMSHEAKICYFFITSTCTFITIIPSSLHCFLLGFLRWFEERTIRSYMTRLFTFITYYLIVFALFTFWLFLICEMFLELFLPFNKIFILTCEVGDIIFIKDVLIFRVNFDGL